MSIMLFNPTNEEFPMQFAGITHYLKPGEKLKVGDAEGNHHLNKFGARGLTQLEWGCDEEQVKSEAVKRNLDFKRRQISEYNQRNEARKQMGLGYLTPTPKIKEYSLELGIGLLEPYTIKDEELSKMTRIEAENRELKGQIADLTAMVKDFIGKDKAGGSPPAPEQPARVVNSGPGQQRK